MKAEGKVFFRTEEFFGTASVVKYNESEEQVIFEGTPGNPATLYKKQPGKAEDQEIKGGVILYNRKTGNFTVNGGKVISGWLERPRGMDFDLEVTQDKSRARSKRFLTPQLKPLTACAAPGSFPHARLSANGEDEQLIAGGAVARDDG